MEKIYKAKTVDEALEAAKAELNTEFDYDVIAEPKKGLFGMKGEAEIKVTYELSKAQKAKKYIENALSLMNIEIDDIEVDEKQDEAYFDIKVSSDYDGAVIGRRGENLDALQYLASLAANRATSDYFRITLDCCGYRAKRKETLTKLAYRMARNAVKTGRSVTLEPMNPYERRIIHSAVSEVNGASSHSEGEEPYRKVVITSNGNFKKKNGHSDRKPRERKEVDFLSSFEKEYKRQSSPETNYEAQNDDVPLYGKFEF